MTSKTQTVTIGFTKHAYLRCIERYQTHFGFQYGRDYAARITHIEGDYYNIKIRHVTLKGALRFDKTIPGKIVLATIV